MRSPRRWRSPPRCQATQRNPAGPRARAEAAAALSPARLTAPEPKPAGHVVWAELRGTRAPAPRIASSGRSIRGICSVSAEVAGAAGIAAVGAQVGGVGRTGEPPGQSCSRHTAAVASACKRLKRLRPRFGAVIARPEPPDPGSAHSAAPRVRPQIQPRWAPGGCFSFHQQGISTTTAPCSSGHTMPCCGSADGYGVHVVRSTRSRDESAAVSIHHACGSTSVPPG